MQQHDEKLKLAEKAFRTITAGIARNHDALEVTATYWPDDPNCMDVNIRASAADTAQIIGKKRKNFDAIALMMVLVGEKMSVKINLNMPLPPVVLENENPGIAKWDEEKTDQELKAIVNLFTTRPNRVIAYHDADKTNYDVCLSEIEKFPVEIGKIGRELSTIFHAVGWMRGRMIYVKGVKTVV